MALIIDFLLLAASGAACFYCWFLNRRLAALTSTKDGIHTGIAALSQSAEEMQSAMSSTKSEASDAAARLETLIAAAEERATELETLARQVEEISAQAVSETETATQGLADILSGHVKEARDAAASLLNAMEAAGADIGTTPTAPEPTHDVEAADESGEDEIEFSVVVDGEKNSEEQAA